MWDLVGGWLHSPLDRAVFFAGVFGTLFGVSNWLRTDTPKSETDRLAVITALRQDRFGKRYKARLKRALDAIDAKLSVAERTNGAAPRAVATAWSYRLLLLSLFMALVYPAFSIVINLSFFNNGSVGGVEIAPSSDIITRTVIISGITIIALADLISKFTRGIMSIIFKSNIIIVGFLFTIVLKNSEGSSLLADMSFALNGFIGIVLVSIILVAIVFTAKGPEAALYAGAIMIAGGASGIDPSASNKSMIFAILGACLGTIAIYWIGTRFGRRATALALWVAIGLAAIGLSTMANEMQAAKRGIILFIGVLPLINGLADFASTGLTRHLLRRSLRTSGRWEAAADLIGGAAICLLLGCAIIAFIEFTPLVDQTRLANLPQIFADLADPATRGQYWWLLVMLASTLIPTALHLHLALATAVRYVPARLRHRIADRFEQAAAADSNLGGRRAVLMLSALNAAAIVIPAWLMIELWITASPLVMGGSIAIFAAFAQAIGAIP